MPAMLLLCICLATLASLGMNFKEIMRLVSGEMTHQISNTEAQKILHDQERYRFKMLQSLSPNGQYLGKGAYSLVPSKTDPNSVCSKDWCIDAPGLTGNHVDTTGTNGQTGKLSHNAADIFTQIAKIIESQNGDPALSGMLTELANQGHSLGDAESNLDSSDFDTVSNGATQIEVGRSNFKRLSSQLNSSIMKLPEASRGIIADASNVILTLANNYNFSQNANVLKMTYVANPVELTHSSANNICGQGGDTAQCIH